MVGHHVEVAIHDVGILHRLGDRGQDAVVVEGVVRIQETDGIAPEQVQALAHGVEHALVLFGQQADIGGLEPLDNLDGVVAGHAVDDEHFLVG